MPARGRHHPPRAFADTLRKKKKVGFKGRLSPATNCKAQHEVPNTVPGGDKNVHRLCPPPSDAVRLRHQEHPIFKPSGPIDAQRKIWKVMHQEGPICTPPPSPAQKPRSPPTAVSSA